MSESQMPEPPVAPSADSPAANRFDAPQTFVAPPPPEPPFPSGPPSPSRAASAAATLNDRPELALGGAFAGGFVLALIFKRIAR